MANSQLTVEEVMEKIREAMKAKKTMVSPQTEGNASYESKMAGEDEFSSLDSELRQNNLKWNVNVEYPITSHRKTIGRFIVFGKKLVRKFLRWYVNPPVDQQREFNGSVTRSLNVLGDFAHNQSQALKEAYAKIQNLESQLHTVDTQFEELSSAGSGLWTLTDELQDKADRNDVELLKEYLAGKASAEELEATRGLLASKVDESKLEAIRDMLAGKADESKLEAIRDMLAGKADESKLESVRDMLAGKADESKLEAIQDMLVGKADEARLEAIQDMLAGKVDEAKLEAIWNMLAGKADLAELNDVRAAVFASRNEVLALADEQAKRRLELELTLIADRLRRLERKINKGLHIELGVRTVERLVQEDKEENLDIDYFLFEQRFRGSREDIKERQKIYLDYFKGKTNVVDLGCGRGEFVELLLEHGIEIQGIDLNEDMVNYCQERGLPVSRRDLMEFLASVPDNSLGGIFAAQVVEHLNPSVVVHLVHLAHRKLKPTGVLVLETINPQNLVAVANWFYMDMSHVRPVHPDTLKFIAESTGYQKIQIVFSSIPKDQLSPLLNDQFAGIADFNHGIEKINSLLFGPQDFALVCNK